MRRCFAESLGEKPTEGGFAGWDACRVVEGGAKRREG